MIVARAEDLTIGGSRCRPAEAFRRGNVSDPFCLKCGDTKYSKLYSNLYSNDDADARRIESSHLILRRISNADRR